MFQMEQKIFAIEFVPNRTKNMTKGTKNVCSENCFKFNRKTRVKVTKSSLYIFTAICGLVGISMALSDLFCGVVWPFMILCMALHGLVWCCMAAYGFMATYRFGIVWSFLAVIDPNSFGLV